MLDQPIVFHWEELDGLQKFWGQSESTSGKGELWGKLQNVEQRHLGLGSRLARVLVGSSRVFPPPAPSPTTPHLHICSPLPLPPLLLKWDFQAGGLHRGQAHLGFLHPKGVLKDCGGGRLAFPSWAFQEMALGKK